MISNVEFGPLLPVGPSRGHVHTDLWENRAASLLTRTARRRRSRRGDRLVQTSLLGDSLPAKDSETFGHSYPENPNTGCAIITFQNIGPQPRDGFTRKAFANARAFRTGNVGVSLVAEHCLSGRGLELSHTFNQRMKRVDASSFSYLVNNRNEEAAWKQVGGTGFTLNRTFRAHKLDHGGDSTGLGRWTHVRFKGKANLTVSMVSAYRPCRSPDHVGSVWNQHRRYFRDHHDIPHPDPHDIFDTDLLAMLSLRLEAGDCVVLGIDHNDDVRTSRLSQGLRSLGLSDAILSLHAPASPPATHNRNTTRTPIDALWVSPSVGITRAGYCPFDGPYGMSSDHRLLWIEVTELSILGKHLPPSMKIPASRLKASDPRSRALYIKRVKLHYNRARIGPRMATLQTHIRDFRAGDASLREDIITSYHSLHETTTAIRQEVERHLRTLFAGNIPWSPRLQPYRDRIDFWRRMVRLRRGVNTSRITLNRLAQRLHLHSGFHDDLPTAIARLQEAYRLYRTEARPFASQWRLEHQQGLIDALAKDRRCPPEVIIAQRKRESQAKLDGAVARAIRGRNTKRAVLMATVEAPDGSLIELHSQAEMVPAMAASNLSRQQECLHTPPMMAPFTTDFGMLADTPAALDVINGTYVPPPSMDKYLVELLAVMTMPDSIRCRGPLDTFVSPEDNRAGWTKQKERTAGEPTCLSFSHHKAACLDSDLNNVDTLLRNVPFLVGFSPQAWRTITDVEILKKPNEFRVSKMRLIQLMSPEFQIQNKMLGRRLLAHAESASAVAPEQHGSRKHHKAINTCLNKKLLCDTLRQKRRAGAVAMNDARGCYDRICHSIAVLTLMSFGLPQHIAVLLFQTLQQATHFIQTGFGRSGPAYGNEPGFSGIGQGNGLGPTLWALISTKLLLMMKAAGHGVHLLTSLSLQAVHLVGFAFVDDTDLFCAGSSPSSSGEDMVPEFQGALDRWAGGLIATGGALAPDKSFCYLVDFEWTGHSWAYRSMDSLPGSFTLLDRYGTRAPLRRFDVDYADKTLGVFISMDGNEQAEYDHLLSTSRTFALQLKAAKCSKNQALYTFSASFMKSIEYAMPVTQFSETEWHKILAPALKPTLQRSGISSSAPRAALFGPALYQGFDIMHPYFNQEICHIMTLVQESVCSSQTGLLLRLSAEALRLEVGVPFTLGDCDYSKYSSYTTDCWYKAVWRFVAKYPISVHEDYPDPPLLRHGDSHLMVLFVRSGFAGHDLYILNLLRMRLRAITVADIATPDGLCVTHQAFLLQHSNHLRDHYDWPREIPLSPGHVSLWQRALRRSLMPPNCAPTNRSLVYSCRVGPWLDPNVHLDLWWWFFSAAENRLYQRLGHDQWRIWSSHSRARFISSHLSRTRPPDAVLASVSPRGDLFRIDNSYPWWFEGLPDTQDLYDPLQARHPCLVAAFQEAIDSPHILLDDVLIPADGATSLAQAIRAGTAAAVSDGSFRPDSSSGAAAFTLATSPDVYDASLRLTGLNFTTGTRAAQSPYRSEAAGIIGVLSAISVLVSQFSITSGALTIALDGLSALNEAKGEWPLEIDRPCFDYLQAIRNHVAALPITIHWRWVEGHQREKGISQMDWWAQMNDFVDSEAKAYLAKCLSSSRPLTNPRLLYERWAVSLSGSKMSCIAKRTIYEVLYAPRILRYWETHHDNPLPVDSVVDWESSRRAIQRLSPGLRRWRWKFATGCIGVGNQLYHRRYQDHSRCPLCSSTNEKVSHVLTCPDAGACSLATDIFEGRFRALLASLDTAPTLTFYMVALLSLWRKKIPILPFQFPLSIRPAIYAQARLGWTNFFLGRWTPVWRTLQEAHYVSISSRRSSLRWTSAIIHHLLLTAWDLWQFRNNRLHGETGPLARAQHALLDSEMSEDIIIGGDGMLPDAARLLSVPLAELRAYTLVDKRLWLDSVRLGRKQYVQVQAPDPEFAQERTLMAAWLRPRP